MTKRLRDQLLDLQEWVEDKKHKLNDQEYLELQTKLKSIYDAHVPEEPPRSPDRDVPLGACLCHFDHQSFENKHAVRENIEAFDLTRYNIPENALIKHTAMMFINRHSQCSTRNCKIDNIYEYFCFLIKCYRVYPLRSSGFVKSQLLLQTCIQKLDLLKELTGLDWTDAVKEAYLESREYALGCILMNDED
jgi:hypothetical protein